MPEQTFDPVAHILSYWTAAAEQKRRLPIGEIFTLLHIDAKRNGDIERRKLFLQATKGEEQAVFESMQFINEAMKQRDAAPKEEVADV